MSSKKDPYGFGRVIKPKGVFPQSADRINPSLPLRSDEMLIEVDCLNIDSASFHQIWSSQKGNVSAVQKQILSIIRSRGKMHNPVTNSGGMLLGTVSRIGSQFPKKFKVGDRIATLVSLSLTPLHVEKILKIIPEKEQVYVTGHAILFASGIAQKIPSDLPESLVLSVLDVCGAPALVARQCRKMKKFSTVVILGGGKAGMLSAVAAKKIMKSNGRVIVLEKDPIALKKAKGFSFVDQAFAADLMNPIATMKIIEKATKGDGADLVVNCVNVPGTEMSSILCAKKSGTVLFFNMATNFQKAVLGAEGVGCETELLMGNGYYPGHADFALNLVRENPALAACF